MQKTGRKNKVYSYEFKLLVVTTMLDKKLGYSECIKEFGLGSTQNGAAYSMLQRWERRYLEEGLEGLMKERRGKINKKGNRTPRPPKLDKSIEEDLIAENQRLKAENEYLKKLHALALSRIKSENGTKPE